MLGQAQLHTPEVVLQGRGPRMVRSLGLCCGNNPKSQGLHTAQVSSSLMLLPHEGWVSGSALPSSGTQGPG